MIVHHQLYHCLIKVMIGFCISGIATTVRRTYGSEVIAEAYLRCHGDDTVILHSIPLAMLVGRVEICSVFVYIWMVDFSVGITAENSTDFSTYLLDFILFKQLKPKAPGGRACWSLTWKIHFCWPCCCRCFRFCSTCLLSKDGIARRGYYMSFGIWYMLYGWMIGSNSNIKKNKHYWSLC